MTEILLFHHAHGLTQGVLDFAGALRDQGHTVHTPDLYDGNQFTDLHAGVAFAEQVGFGEIIGRGAAAAAALPSELVYAGFSLGTLPAQALTQNRPGALGALLFHGGEPTEVFGQPWPPGVPLQMHIAEADPWTELSQCKSLADQIAGAELYVYPGSAHLFADPGSDEYDSVSAALLMDRTLTFLERLG